MNPKSPTQMRMSNLREESAHYEQQLTRQVHSVLDSLKLENILAGLRNFFRHQLWRRRTLYALGAAFVVFLVLKGMLGGRRRVKVLAGSTGEGEGALVVEHKSSGGFWSRLIQDAIRTFLLSYARKVLMDYIARKTEQRAD